MSPPAIAPELVWGIALRLIAVTYIIAFWSLHRELLALCGSRGILHARKARLMATLELAAPPSSPVVPGFMLVMPALGSSLLDPDERLPALAMRSDGEWTYNGTRVQDRRCL